ncbi:MAG: hypothetical protein C5B43_00415 [Verrucomicrobia bacterium]|nr:MAG: hypothetical protein C5B43_00415 [Verrucomicrobiota bacterium]
MDNLSKETLILLAYLYLEHFKYEKALTLLKALNLIFPNDIEIIRYLAYAYLKNSDFQSALRYIEICLKTESSEKLKIAANIIKSKALWGLGKEEAARHTIMQAIAQVPSIPEPESIQEPREL